ncbi:hypothetical protein E2I00_003920 [Balaenoptera physalus]|uniref:Uncharacterized protein n=1 Tax=Balaenoptera physalus TaxID=9770 RepID=A0A643BPS9_BALPH|nr:hypothetical protein E2I00_003920 [Balaenoptera physalus]
MYVRCVPSARYTALSSQGNAVDLGQMNNFYIGLGTRINCNISNYSGCSVSLGKPSEKNLYADSGLAGPAHQCAMVVLPFPLTPGMRIAFPDTKKTCCCDAFPNT